MPERDTTILATLAFAHLSGFLLASALFMWLGRNGVIDAERPYIAAAMLIAAVGAAIGAWVRSHG